MVGRLRKAGRSFWRPITRRRRVDGICGACGVNVHADERSVQIRGVRLHRRCVAYRPRRAR